MQIVNNNMNFNDKNVQNNYILTLKRPKSFVGAIVKWKIFIDGVEVAKIKNGQIINFNVTQGDHTVSINDCPASTIFISGNTTADIVAFSLYDFGIVNISGNTNQETNMNIKKTTSIYIYKFSIYLLIANIVNLFLYIFIFNHLIVLLLLLAQSTVNIFVVIKQKKLLNDKYAISLMFNIFSLLIGIITFIVYELYNF